MKTIICALALAITVPVVAQPAPAPAPHAGHAQHQGMDHAQHQAGQHDCKDCCEKTRQPGGQMQCTAKKDQARPPAPASGGHGAHSGSAH